MGFEADIRSLFRPIDQEEMAYAFDLWSFDDVKSNAELILERVEDGTMPCDVPWTEEQLDTFRRWVADGFPP